MYVFEMDISIIKVSKDGLSYAFQVGYEEAIDGLTNVSFYSMETVVTEMAHRRTLDHIFDRSMEKWTKYSTFMDAFTSCALASSRFVRPIAKFIRAKDREGSQQGRQCWERT